MANPITQFSPRSIPTLLTRWATYRSLLSRWRHWATKPSISGIFREHCTSRFTPSDLPEFSGLLLSPAGRISSVRVAPARNSAPSTCFLKRLLRPAVNLLPRAREKGCSQRRTDEYRDRSSVPALRAAPHAYRSRG